MDSYNNLPSQQQYMNIDNNQDVNRGNHYAKINMNISNANRGKNNPRRNTINYKPNNGIYFNNHLQNNNNRDSGTFIVRENIYNKKEQDYSFSSDLYGKKGLEQSYHSNNNIYEFENNFNYINNPNNDNQNGFYSQRNYNNNVDYQNNLYSQEDYNNQMNINNQNQMYSQRNNINNSNQINIENQNNCDSQRDYNNQINFNNQNQIYSQRNDNYNQINISNQVNNKKNQSQQMNILKNNNKNVKNKYYCF